MGYCVIHRSVVAKSKLPECVARVCETFLVNVLVGMGEISLTGASLAMMGGSGNGKSLAA